MSKPVRKRYVSGPFGEVGYVLKKPSDGKVMREVLDERTRRMEEQSASQNQINQMKHDEYMKQFWVSTDLHSLNQRISRFVDLGLEAREKDMDVKRNKLKVLMLNEQSNLAQEYTDKAQKSADQVFEMKKKKAEEIERTAQDAEKSFVEKAYERIFKDNCDELRTKVLRENRAALNDIHKMQMCEKLLVEDLEKEDEKVWLALAEEEDARRRKRSEKETARVDQLAKDYVSGLDQQIRDAEYQKQNEDCIERLEEGWRREIQKKKEEYFDIRDAEAKEREKQTARDIIEQLEINRLIRERQKKEEAYLDKLMIDADLEAYRAELAAVVDNRAQLRSELALFKESLKQYTDAVEEHNKASDKASEADNVKVQAMKREALVRAAMARKGLLKECVEVRKEQVRERKAREGKISKEDQDYFELMKYRLAQNEQLSKVWSDEMHQNFRKQSEMNNQQEKYTDVLHQREQQSVLQMVQDREDKEEQTGRKIQELLKAPLAVVAGTGVHPFLPPLVAARK